MSLRKTLAGLALVLSVSGAGYVIYRYFVLPRHPCELCGRILQAEHKSKVVLENKQEIETCCPRCALHGRDQMPGNVSRVLVADHISGELIAAEQAHYVEGSDEHPCLAPADSPPREPGVQYDLKYDRCLPSLVAFREESSAGSFQRQHGGRVVTYAQAHDSIHRH